MELRTFSCSVSKPVPADLARCLWRGASTNGMGWSAPQVGRADNRAKSAACSACFVSGRLILNVTKRARAERLGPGTL